MLKIREIAAKRELLNAHGDGVDSWDRVMAEAARAGAPFKDELSGLGTWVKELCGGLQHPIFLNEYRDFVRTLQRQRVLRGHVYKAVGELKIGGTEGSCPFFRLATTAT